jgi:FkbM family methyltransferase
LNRVACFAPLLRLLPSAMRGKQRLARWLVGGSPVLRREITLTMRDGQRLTTPNGLEPIAFSLLISGEYEPEVLEVLQRRAQPGDTMLDVGANLGAFTLPLARHVGPAGRVFAIEASPAVFPHLERNLRANQAANVRAIHAAAAERAGQVTFFDAPAHQFGMSGLGNLAGSTAHTVAATTLDELMAGAGVTRVTAMKVDVEGFEVLVFKGARRLLESGALDFIAFEFLDWAEQRVPGHRPGDAQRFLLQLGFKLWRLEDYRRGRPPLEHVLEAGGDMLVAVRE